MSQSELISDKAALINQLYNFKAKKAENNDDKFDALINEIQGKIDEISLKLTSGSVQDPNVAYLASLKVQTLSTAFKRVKPYMPGAAVEAHIDELDSLYAIHVAPEVATTPELEEAFVRNAKTSLDRQIFIQLSNSNTTTNDYKSYREYLLTTHGSKASVFQYLSRSWQIQLKSDESVVTFAARVDKGIREAATRIKAKYKTDHKDSPDMTVDQAFSIMSSMLISEQLKACHPTVYALTTKKMDTLWNPVSIAEEAQLYLDRGIGAGQDDEVINFATNARGSNYKGARLTNKGMFKQKRQKTPHAKPQSPHMQAQTSLNLQQGQRNQNNKLQHSGQQHRRQGQGNNQGHRQGQRGSRGRQQQSSNQASPGTCFNYMDGKPCIQNPCPYVHVPRAAVNGHNNNYGEVANMPMANHNAIPVHDNIFASLDFQ